MSRDEEVEREVLALNADLRETVGRAIRVVDSKRKSRVWFGRDSEYLDALCTAQEACRKVLEFAELER